MASQARPGTRRLPSQAWSRLKPSSNDALESVGLPSKGETRLNDFKAQENYYAKITERYMKLCAEAGNQDELDKQFAAMSMEANNGAPRAAKNLARPANINNAAMTPSNTKYASPELGILLSAMRKLREAVVASKRVDAFAQQAYVFIIRAAILVKAMESYHPALLYLLQNIHRHTPLPPAELSEFVGYRVIDLACREHDLVEAYKVRHHYQLRDRKVEKILHALTHDDWVTYWRVRRTVDGHQRRLLEWSETNIRLHALKCLARSYFTAEKEYVERSANLQWPILVQQCEIGWSLEGERVTIRRPKRS